MAKLTYALPADLAKVLEDERCINIDHAFAILGISSDTGYKLLNTGQLPYFFVNKTRKVQIGALREYIRKGQEEVAAALRGDSLAAESDVLEDEPVMA